MAERTEEKKDRGFGRGGRGGRKDQRRGPKNDKDDW
jgi:hypothetical protein